MDLGKFIKLDDEVVLTTSGYQNDIVKGKVTLIGEITIGDLKIPGIFTVDSNGDNNFTPISSIINFCVITPE